MKVFRGLCLISSCFWCRRMMENKMKEKRLKKGVVKKIIFEIGNLMIQDKMFLMMGVMKNKIKRID